MENLSDDERDRLREEFVSRLPQSARIDAANRHIECSIIASEITESNFRNSTQLQNESYHSFLAGWDAAMELRFPELLEENHELHCRIADIENEKLKKEYEHGPDKAEG